jgi:large subunit ribosomal protein L6
MPIAAVTRRVANCSATFGKENRTMSRIGKQPIPIPDKVKVEIKNHTVLVEGPKGKVTKSFAPVVNIAVANKQVLVTPSADNSRFAKAMYGTVRSVIAGMVKGASVGYAKDLEIQGVGFKANLKGKQLDLALGYSHPIVMDVPEGIKITVVDGTKLKVEGADKQLVGAVTAEIRSYYPPEPYKGKGVRIVGERVRRKEGKTVA